MRLVNARVTAYTGAAARPVLTIDRGTRAGIQDGTVVAHGFNLVGRVVHAGPLTADVRLITHREQKLQVRLVPPGPDAEPRRVRVQIEQRDDGHTFGVQVSRSVTVEKGDLAHLADVSWPREARGFVVGQVRSVKRAPEDPYSFKNVVIEPIPPLTTLSEVTALVPME